MPKLCKVCQQLIPCLGKGDFLNFLKFIPPYKITCHAWSVKILFEGKTTQSPFPPPPIPHMVYKILSQSNLCLPTEKFIGSTG